VLLTLLMTAGWARDVVWLAPPQEGDVARVAERPEVERPDRSIVALRASRTARGEADARAWRALAEALAAARRYETQLDGERLILELLVEPLRDVTIVPDEAARDQLFEVYAYQGFAVNRLFGARLAEAEDAAPWRIERGGQVVERPWALAWALDPERDITPYEVAEAPQRVAYSQRKPFFASTLDGIVALPELGPADVVFVDGRRVERTSGGQLTLPPGRHWIHVERQGLVIERFVPEVEPGRRVELASAVAPGRIAAWAAGVGDGAPVPDDIRPFVDAMGEVWLARPTAASLVLYEVTDGVLRGVEVPRAAVAIDEPGADDWRVSVGVLGGWLASDDFYLQDPIGLEPAFGTVNAITLGGYAQGGVKAGPVWLGAGLDVLVPVGEAKVARSGDQGVRPRAVPHVAVGTSWLQATAGVLFPYHAAVGGRLQGPVGERLEARVSGWVGIAPSRERVDDVWQGEPVFTLTAGLGYRLGGVTR